MCIVVNLRSSKYTVYIGRAGHGQDGRFGNPFRVGKDGAQGECVKLFRDWLYGESREAYEMRCRIITEIPYDAVLGCFCKPRACHGDVIAELVNAHHADRARERPL